MMCNAGCWKRRFVVLAIATSLLSGCAADGSEMDNNTVCPPVVEYTRDVQARAVQELELLPERSLIVKMMGEYAVMRDQAQVCAGRVTR